MLFFFPRYSGVLLLRTAAAGGVATGTETVQPTEVLLPSRAVGFWETHKTKRSLYKVRIAFI